MPRISAWVSSYLTTNPVALEGRGRPLAAIVGLAEASVCECFLNRDFQVWASDRDEKQVRMAERRFATPISRGQLSIRRCPTELIDLDDESADFIVAAGLLGRTTWDRWGLQELGRVLKPDGRLLVWAPDGFRLRPIVAKAIRGVRGRLNRRTVRTPKPGLATSAIYRGRALAWREHASRLLDEVGFDILDEARPNRSWLAGSVFECRRQPQPENIAQRPIFLDVRNLQDRFQAHHGDGLERLEQWMLAHPQLQPDPPVAFESRVRLSEPALVLSPHPDDELIGCGGTLLRMRSAGAPITIVQLTDGGASAGLAGSPPGEARMVRVREAETVAAELGAELCAWGEPDSHLRCSEANVMRLKSLLESRRPKCIFAPFLSDPHPDHVATAAILAGALGRCSLDLDRLLVAGYEVWALAPVNAYSTISNQFDRRARLLFKYPTAMKVVDYAAFCESLHGMRHVSWTGRAGYAEGFHIATASEYLKLFGGGRSRHAPRAAA